MDKEKLKNAFVKTAKKAIERGRVTKEELEEMITGGKDVLQTKNKTTKRKRKGESSRA